MYSNIVYVMGLGMVYEYFSTVAANKSDVGGEALGHLYQVTFKRKKNRLNKRVVLTLERLASHNTTIIA